MDVPTYEQLIAKWRVDEAKKAERAAKKVRREAEQALAALAAVPAASPAEEELADARPPPAAAAAALGEEYPPALAPAPAGVFGYVPRPTQSFVSLINTELWKKHWHKCFDRIVATETDVQIGDTGSIGIGYGVSASLDSLIEGKTEEDAVAALAEGGAISASGASLTPHGIRSTILFFYKFSKSPNGELFGIKRGTKAMWVAEKISGYVHAPPAERAEGGLISEHQREANFFEHRFGFRIVAVVREEEQEMVHHVQLVKKHTVTF